VTPNNGWAPTPARRVFQARLELEEALTLGADLEIREVARLLDEWLSTRSSAVRRDLAWYYGAEQLARMGVVS
jgi:hypothetical protein